MERGKKTEEMVEWIFELTEEKAKTRANGGKSISIENQVLKKQKWARRTEKKENSRAARGKELFMHNSIFILSSHLKLWAKKWNEYESQSLRCTLLPFILSSAISNQYANEIHKSELNMLRFASCELQVGTSAWRCKVQPNHLQVAECVHIKAKRYNRNLNLITHAIESNNAKANSNAECTSHTFSALKRSAIPTPSLASSLYIVRFVRLIPSQDVLRFFIYFIFCISNDSKRENGSLRTFVPECISRVKNNHRVMKSQLSAFEAGSVGCFLDKKLITPD